MSQPVSVSSPAASPDSAPGTPPRQLAFPLDHVESFERDDFLSGPSNRSALSLIERWPDWPGPIMVLAGPEGAGKSHLAAIWAQLSGARFISARALSSAEVPAALATGALVVEDLVPGTFDERALFHLINLVREERAFVLATARTSPAGWNLRVPDLASRLRVLPAVHIEAPDDSLLRAVIVKLFADRQLAVEESLVSYLATHIERSFGAARAAVDRLDREALRLKRPVTRALAATCFREP